MELYQEVACNTTQELFSCSPCGTFDLMLLSPVGYVGCLFISAIVIGCRKTFVSPFHTSYRICSHGNLTASGARVAAPRNGVTVLTAYCFMVFVLFCQFLRGYFQC